MSRRDDRELDPALDQRLGELLVDAVSRIEPDDRLGELRARVSRPRRRPALVVLAGSALAGAAVVTAVAVGPGLLGSGQDDPADPPVASSPNGEPSDARSDSPGPTRAPVATREVGAYYLGDTPAGARLYREDQQTDAPDTGPDVSLEVLTSDPADPDYRTLWPADAFAGGAVEDDRIIVELADQALLDRPQQVDQDEAEASVQQVVYTMQSYAQQELPVEFRFSGAPADRVLGVPVPEPVAAEPVLETLSLVSLEEPAEGEAVSGRVRVTGVASSPEATVPWTLRDEGGQTVEEGFFTAEGYLEPRLFPFGDTLDLSSVETGTYTLVVTTDDASGGAEGPGAYADSRTIVVE